MSKLKQIYSQLKSFLDINISFERKENHSEAKIKKSKRESLRKIAVEVVLIFAIIVLLAKTRYTQTYALAVSVIVPVILIRYGTNSIATINSLIAVRTLNQLGNTEKTINTIRAQMKQKALVYCNIETISIYLAIIALFCSAMTPRLVRDIPLLFAVSSFEILVFLAISISLIYRDKLNAYSSVAILGISTGLSVFLGYLHFALIGMFSLAVFKFFECLPFINTRHILFGFLNLIIVVFFSVIYIF